MLEKSLGDTQLAEIESHDSSISTSTEEYGLRGPVPNSNGGNGGPPTVETGQRHRFTPIYDM